MNNEHVDNMSFLEHLEELRWHILRSIFAIIATGLVCFVMKDFIFDTIIFGPKIGGGFYAQPFFLNAGRQFYGRYIGCDETSV